ncbi:MAG: hypothetical protein ABI300_10655 [Rhodanobacter sp.]
MLPRADRSTTPRHTPWYRQGVVWLGVAVFVASIAGCVWIITVGLRHADTPVQTGRAAVFGVPAAAHSAAPPPRSADSP